MPDSVCYYKATIPEHLISEVPAQEFAQALLSMGAGRMDAEGFHFRVRWVDKRGTRFSIEEDVGKRRRHFGTVLGALMNRKQVSFMLLSAGGYVWNQHPPEWYIQMVEKPPYEEIHEEDADIFGHY
jgi:hypothetical protein